MTALSIAYVLADPGIGVFGTKGASVHVQEVVRALRADGHRVTVFCTRTDDHVPADLADLDVQRIVLPRGRGPERERAVAAASAEIAQRIAGGGFDLVYERYSLFADTAARLAGRIPSILEVNAPLVDEQRRHRSLADEAGAISATVAQLQGASLVSCVSGQVAAWALQHGAVPDRLQVTPNGVNTARITPSPARSPRHPSPGHRAPVTVGFVGTLKPWHGTDVLVQALARTRGDLTLEVCGTGPEQSALEELAADLRLGSRIRFHGAVPPEKVPGVLHRLDIACAPYPPGDHYFSPLKVYEYLAAGLPVVASAIGAIPEILQHGRLGRLVPPGDVDALASALDALVADPAERALLGAAGREAAVTGHDWRIRCRELLQGALTDQAATRDAVSVASGGS
ncbi:MAG: glycosyltransferase family 4 protein [Brachybacterium sp.]|nr:glycosyltransferase family 4 protein [Brachybacterium sp.]